MADNIEHAINKMKETVKNGKYKFRRVKLKTKVSKGLSSDAAKSFNDNISRIKRRQINKKARLKAHSPAADMKAAVSKDLRKDLGLSNGREEQAL